MNLKRKVAFPLIDVGRSALPELEQMMLQSNLYGPVLEDYWGYATDGICKCYG